MKKTLIAIGLAVATLPLTFAAQAPSAPPANNTATSSTTTKKHVKKTHKSKTPKTTPGSNTPAAKPVAK